MDPRGLRGDVRPVPGPKGAGDARKGDTERATWTTVGAWRVRDGEGKTEEAEDQNGKERAESEAFGTRDVSPWGLMKLSRSNWDLR